jgi:hypothetical protein
MEADHIFIFTDDDGKVADQLIEFGLTEGSNRVHVGQGTTNRKFYFDNFFLEVLWVHDTNEIKSEKIKPIGLWQRGDFKINNFSPFGLCIVNTSETDEFFKDSFKYQPDYFPQGQTIDILKNENQSSLPWTFRLPFKGQKKNINEPTKHKNGISLLTKTIFEHQQKIEATFLNFFGREQNIEFKKSDRTWLNLTFDNGTQGLTTEFETLKLTIHY